VRVLITGGTGSVGSHTAAALINHGHWVRMLVRDESRVGTAMAAHGVAPSDVVMGDVTDQASVAVAVAGCDALIHGANVFTFDPTRADRMRRVNEQGTEITLREAANAGLDPIVAISSFVALLPANGPVTEQTEVGSPQPEYAKSKAAAERVARRFQAEGSPVVITYPGAVWGPDDPYFGETAQLAQNALRGKLRLLNDGPIPISDVR